MECTAVMQTLTFKYFLTDLLHHTQLANKHKNIFGINLSTIYFDSNNPCCFLFSFTVPVHAAVVITAGQLATITS